MENQIKGSGEMNNITKAQFNSLIFCMAQRAIQESKVGEYIKLIKELEGKKHENICKTKDKM